MCVIIVFEYLLYVHVCLSVCFLCVLIHDVWVFVHICVTHVYVYVIDMENVIYRHGDRNLYEMQLVYLANA